MDAIQRRNNVTQAVLELVLSSDENIAVVAEKLKLDFVEVRNDLTKSVQDYKERVEGKTKRTPGRKSFFSPEVVDEIVELTRRGVYPHVASAKVGIAPPTFWEWLKRPEPKFVEF